MNIIIHCSTACLWLPLSYSPLSLKVKYNILKTILHFKPNPAESISNDGYRTLFLVLQSVAAAPMVDEMEMLLFPLLKADKELQLFAPRPIADNITSMSHNRTDRNEKLWMVHLSLSVSKYVWTNGGQHNLVVCWANSAMHSFMMLRPTTISTLSAKYDFFF